MDDAKKVRVAVIKYEGLISGGSEKLLQIIAAYLPKNQFVVDYFWCNSADTVTGAQVTKYPTSEDRRNFLLRNNVQLHEFHVNEIDLTTPTMRWRGTDFWDVFNEEGYDVILTGLAGHKQYPFTKLRKKPIVEIINLQSGSDNQYNIARVLHLCRWSAERWSNLRGGDASRVEIVSLPIATEELAADTDNLRSELGIDPNVFVYGMHQRAENVIFSHIPLEAYKEIETDTTAYVLMGGGSMYDDQVERLGIKHFYQISPASDSRRIGAFLRTLNVFAHGRADGEVNSQAMAEAMFFGLPIVSHPSPINNGHIENIGHAGTVCGTMESYTAELSHLRDDAVYYADMQQNARLRFAEHYELSGQIQNYARILQDVVHNPYPHPLRRLFMSLHWRQNLRVFLVLIYLKLKYVSRHLRSAV